MTIFEIMVGLFFKVFLFKNLSKQFQIIKNKINIKNIF